ncbi:MAG: DUF4974 domain-containing protein [Bacteroidales bacterium]|nr:DUF4974 domain-containing protein [Bacteroidales bacterium]
MRESFNREVFESMPDTVYTGKMPKIAPAKKRITFIYKTAAAAVVTALAVSTTLLALRLKEKPEMAAMTAQSEIVYTVNNALQGNIVLPDSTLVTLNSGSSLRVAEDFGTGTRTVYLDGEGYFDVKKDRKVPFLIKTPQDILVTVTGTSFNVKCFSDSPRFNLTLIKGSVEVTTRSNEVIKVSPSEEIVINSDFHNVSKIEKPENNLMWKEGVLRFDHTPMSETIAQIERWYGVDIEVEDQSVFASSFTAEFKHESLNEVLRLLCITSRLEYTRDGDMVKLKKSNKQ